jgi:hypothetical protein
MRRRRPASWPATCCVLHASRTAPRRGSAPPVRGAAEVRHGKAHGRRHTHSQERLQVDSAALHGAVQHVQGIADCVVAGGRMQQPVRPAASQ